MTEPPEFDLNTPNIGRIHDYFLGGSANTAADREAGVQMLRGWSQGAAWSQLARACLRRIVTTLVDEYGLDQFLDLGSGIPTVGNVHEVAHRSRPDARVAYVDFDPLAVHYARNLLGEHETRVSTTCADLREPTTVLSAPGVAELLDFSRPVAVLAIGVLDLTGVQDLPGLIASYRAACAPGSAFALTQAAQMRITDAEISEAREALRGTSTPTITYRNQQETAALLTGYELLEPGVVPLSQWRPHYSDSTAADPDRSNGYAAVGKLPAP